MRNNTAYFEKTSSSGVKIVEKIFAFNFAQNISFTTASFLKISNIISHLFSS